MKKKLVLSMLVGMSLCVTACGKSDVETETTQSTEAVSVTEAVTEEETEESAEMQEDDSKEKEEITLDEAKLEQMLKDTLDWITLQYVYAENPNINELTAAQAVPMAMEMVGQTQEELEQDEEYNLIVPENLLEEAMKNLFGKVYDTSEYIPTEHDGVRRSEDGRLSLVVGDWGLWEPRFSVEKIEQDKSSNAFIVNVKYFSYDLEEEKNAEGEYVVHYYLAPSEESSYGFVITNMVGEKATVSEESNLTE